MRGVRPAGFFVIRSCLLPGTPADDDAALKDPITREALARASPSLMAAVAGTRKSHKDVGPALTRYLQRMRGRATPFGLMAGYSMGSVENASTEIRLVPRESYLRVIRLELDCITRILDATAHRTKPTTWTARRDLLRLPDIFRVAARMPGGSEVHLSDIRRSEAMDLLIEKCRVPMTFAAIVNELIAFGSDEVEAAAFVESAIAHRLLVPGDTPSPLADDELVAIEHAGTSQLARSAREVRVTPLGGGIPAGERSLQAAIRACSGGFSEKDLIVDLVKPCERAVLGPDVMEAARKMIDLLHRCVHSYRDGRLLALRKWFLQRFEMREVPLVEALDPRRGFGFPSDIAIPDDQQATARHAAWLLRIFDSGLRSSNNEVHLDERDLPPEDPEPLPESFALAFQLTSDDRLWNPLLVNRPGTSLFARATALDSRLKECVRNFLQTAASTRPDEDFADVAYFVPGRSAAFLQYPPLYPFEITLTANQSDSNRTIDINDLLLAVRGGRLVLRSQKSGRYVQIRATSAAYPNRADTTDLFRFLYTLSFQGQGGPWDWGYLGRAPTLPRVLLDNHVVSPASWRLTAGETAAMRSATTRGELVAAVRDVRRKRAIPQRVVFTEGWDLELHVDLEDASSIEACLDVAPETMVFSEAFPIDRSAVIGPEGPYHHQIVVPFLHESADGHRSPSASSDAPRPSTEFTFDAEIPGGRVLYLSFAGDRDELLEVLLQLADTVVNDAHARGVISGWFFLPYAAPDPHIRLRFFGERHRLYDELLPQIHEVLHPYIATRVLSTVSLDTYDRETYRYGGAVGMDVAERIFRVSSEMAIAIHKTQSFDFDDLAAGDALLPLLASQRNFLQCASSSLDDCLRLARRAADSYERGSDPAKSRDIAAKTFRQIRPKLADLLGSHNGAGPLEAELRELMQDKLTTAIRSGEVTRTFDDLIIDLLHVHSVRILTVWHSIQNIEAISYQLLAKWIDMERALARNARC